MEEIIAFAAQKHEGQVRKLSSVPYIVHPINVANILKALNEKRRYDSYRDCPLSTGSSFKSKKTFLDPFFSSNFGVSHL